MTKLQDKINRREFLSYAAKGAVAIAASSLLPFIENCGTVSSNQAKNYIGPGVFWHDWNWMAGHGYSPGVDWSVGGGTPIVACADGFVMQIHSVLKELSRTGASTAYHLGGMEIIIGHDDIEKKDEFDSFHHRPAYVTQYSHVNIPKVSYGNIVKRGQIIGSGGTGSDGIVKLMMREDGNLVNPMIYGPRYSQVDYYYPEQVIDNTDIRIKLEKQKEIVKTINSAYKGNSVMSKVHRKGYYGTCAWSWPEIFKYYEKEYESRPDKFIIPQEQFNALKNQFYDNQPIIITFPFIKPT